MTAAAREIKPPAPLVRASPGVSSCFWSADAAFADRRDSPMPDPRSVLKEYRSLEQKRAARGLTPDEEARHGELRELVGAEPPAADRSGFDVNAAAARLRDSLLPAGLRNRPPPVPEPAPEPFAEIDFEPEPLPEQASEDGQSLASIDPEPEVDPLFDPASLAVEGQPGAAAWDSSAPAAEYDPDAPLEFDPNAAPAFDPDAPLEFDPNAAAAFDPDAPLEFDPNAAAAFDPDAPLEFDPSDPATADALGLEQAALEVGMDPEIVVSLPTPEAPSRSGDAPKALDLLDLSPEPFDAVPTGDLDAADSVYADGNPPAETE